ncbi:RING-CH-type domain-containing protein [Caenorhabditis elegans]|uniref:RING-CH-type domain-containing protein n=1 Tax=Caenorhabditis elegans TaxID=6239 RepID=Q20802_CAEEL|nr:RING-CH-type domain-containing protein [Caenorhabditis elegans]CAA96660.1 RING-CH-type domain-containing protein [Caenorhabditis elegans]|eukprot:NP_505973.1 Uncharacterized protein CELE_F55A11.7 [Caenorhabditis elegans]
MDAEAYFPADISVVPRDETNVTAPTTEEEKKAASVPMTSLMNGRRRRDPTLLSTILEVPSTSSLLPADASIFCLLCQNKIRPTSPNFVKPCQCPLVFVHTTCAIDNEAFFGTNCTQCHQMYRPEQATPRQSPTKTTRPVFTTKTPTKTSLPYNLESGTSCVLCLNQKYQNPEWSEQNDAKLIRPCFCGTLVHHGCITERLKLEKTCQWCEVKYRYFKYGSFVDFCRRYYIQHLCYVFLFAFVLTMFGIAFHGSLIFHETVEFATIVLSVLAFFFFVLFVGACIFTINHTIVTRLPRFRRRYGNITVVPYDPDVRSKKEVLRSLKAAQSESFNERENTPLNPPKNLTDMSLEAIRSDSGDLSIGQQMFGITSNARIFSSTPLTHKTKMSVFGNSEA